MPEYTEHLLYFYLTDLLGTKVFNINKKIGVLGDLTILDVGKYPQIKNIFVSRPFGDKPLVIPWEKVKSFAKKVIVIDIGENLSIYEKEPEENMILLNDQILDKKIIDTQDRDVEVVYDIRLELKENKLYVSDADLSKYRMLQRLGLKVIGDFLQYIAGKMRDQKVPWEYIQHLPKNIGGFKGDLRLNVLKEKLKKIQPVDLASIIEELDYNQRSKILEMIDTKLASEVLEKSGPNLQRDIFETISLQKITEVLSNMTIGQIADILSSLPHAQAQTILKTYDEHKAQKIKILMEKHEEVLHDLVTDKVILCPPNMKAGEAQDQYQKIATGKNVTMYLYIIDEKNHLLGVLDIKELLLANANNCLQDIMTNNVITLTPKSAYKDAFEIFERYNFRAIPFCDNHGILLGAITYKDFMDFKHKFID